MERQQNVSYSNFWSVVLSSLAWSGNSGYQYRAAPGTAKTSYGDNDTPVQSQPERDSVFQREAVAGNESSRQRTCRG